MTPVKVWVVTRSWSDYEGYRDAFVAVAGTADAASDLAVLDIGKHLGVDACANARVAPISQGSPGRRLTIQDFSWDIWPEEILCPG